MRDRNPTHKSVVTYILKWCSECRHAALDFVIYFTSLRKSLLSPSWKLYQLSQLPKVPSGVVTMMTEQNTF